MNKSLADQYMEKYSLDALIATQPISLLYFSGFYCWINDWMQEWMSKPGGSNSCIPLMCILPHRSEPILIIPSILGPFGVSTLCKDIRLFGGIPTVPKHEDLSIDFATLDESDKASIGII